MSRIATLTHPNATSASAVAVVASDIDSRLVSKLYIGDRVLLEINGTRIHSENLCPLVAETAWSVATNNPPNRGQRPTEEHTLVLTHPHMHPLTLHYSNLLNLPPKQPAVFQERDAKLSDGAIYVILQMISYYIPVDQVDAEFTPWDREAASLVLKDREWRKTIIESWIKMLKPFRRPGWGQKSVCRFALRSFVKPSVIEAFQHEDMDAVCALSLSELLRIHEAIHWLPHFLCQSAYSALEPSDVRAR